MRQPALLLSFDEQRDRFGGRQESHPVVVLAAGHPEGTGNERGSWGRSAPRAGLSTKICDSG